MYVSNLLYMYGSLETANQWEELAQLGAEVPPWKNQVHLRFMFTKCYNIICQISAQVQDLGYNIIFKNINNTQIQN